MEQSIRFGNWIWDPNAHELRNGSNVVNLEPRVAQLLVFFSTHPGELLSHDRIVAAVWDGRIVSDEAVRRAVFSLRRALSVDGADSYIRTIRKKGYVATFPECVPVDPVAASVPQADAIASTHPAGRVTTPAVYPEKAHPTRGAASSYFSTAARVVGAVALVLAVALRLDSLWEREQAVSQLHSPATVPATIAVLPFLNLSDEPDTEFLADGIAEELLGTLARQRDLRVTARSSAFQLKGQAQDVREVGRRLSVHYVLEGSVRKSAEQVRINARLIDTHTGTQLWADTYDRTLDDWFALQQNVAMEVTRALESVLQAGDGTSAPPAQTNNVAAHMEVLRARQLLSSRSVADAEQAIEHLQRALSLDPNYALAYARLADAMLIQSESTTGIKAARPAVTPLLDKAIALDPGLGEAYALRSMLTDDPALAERELRKGLELNPSYARGYELLARLQSGSLNKLELARHTIDRAIALDPLTPGNYYTKAGPLMAEGDWAGAAALYRRALELNPQFREAAVGLGIVSTLQGNLADGILYTERAIALDPRAVLLRDQLATLYLAIGDANAAQSISNPPPVFVQVMTLWSKGEIRQIADSIYSNKAGAPALIPAEYLSQILLTQALSDHDYARALNFLSTAYHMDKSLPASAVLWHLYAYANLVQLLAASGDAAAASQLQKQIEARMDAIETRFPYHAKLYNHVRATLLAHAGLSEEACAAFARTATPNPGPKWGFVITNPAFDTMRTTPCFQALLRHFEAHAAAERIRLDAMRRSGQVPDRTTVLVERDGQAAT